MDRARFFELFEGDDEFLEFGRIPPSERLSNRPDLHAFLILDRIIPGNRDMVSAAEHDEIYLEVNPETLCELCDEKTLVDLIRCGVRYDGDTDSLAMFV